MSVAVFLGGGRITAALICGLRGAGFSGRLVVYDRHPKKLRSLQKKYRVEIAANPHQAAEQAAKLTNHDVSLFLIAVRPGDVGPLLATLAPLKSRTVVVSLAAGVPLRLLRYALGPHAEWARAMPSPAARAGLGLTALAFDRAMRPKTRRRVREFFARVGAVIEIPERKFDAFTVVYSTSQGYEALRARVRAARRLGLDRDTAIVAAAHSLAAGITALGSMDGLEESLREAATPGGIAAQVLETMHAAGYERIIELAFREGLKRARKAGTITTQRGKQVSHQPRRLGNARRRYGVRRSA